MTINLNYLWKSSILVRWSRWLILSVQSRDMCDSVKMLSFLPAVTWRRSGRSADRSSKGTDGHKPTVIHHLMLHNHSVIHFRSISHLSDERNKLYTPNLLQIVAFGIVHLYIKLSGMICTLILVEPLWTLSVHVNFSLLEFYLSHLALKTGFLQVNLCYSYLESMY